MRFDPKDLAAGGIFIAIGSAFALTTIFKLKVGTAARMGPGYFPIALGTLLALLGLAIIFRGIGKASSLENGFAWRGFALIGISPVIFGVLVVPFGLVPALFVSTLVAAFSSSEVGVWRATLVTAGLTLFCVAVFTWALQLPIQLFGPVLKSMVG